MEACRHYVRINGKLGQAFVRSFESAIEQITQNPTAWPVIEEDIRRYLLKCFP